jgi:catechol 2,3-dioxygenase-like lactoylglutathione lyase family enzyme
MQDRGATMEDHRDKGGVSATSFELVVIPVSDVDRAKAFYAALGWHCDIDHAAGNDIRIVQFTPTGSAGSIMFGRNITTAQPGSVEGLHLIVPDIEAARDDLLRRGIEISEPFHDPGGIFHRASAEGRASGPNPQRKSYASYASFRDPDGNGWVLQEVTARLSADIEPGDTRFTRQLVNAALGIAMP